MLRNYIDTEWPTQPTKIRLAFCGEAAGAEEEKTGRPFVGRAGQLLDQLLLQACIPRRCVLITNVFQLRPRNNKIDEFFTRPPVIPPFPLNTYQGTGVR